MDELRLPPNLDRPAAREIAVRHSVELERARETGSSVEQVGREQFAEIKRIAATVDNEAMNAFVHMYFQEKRAWDIERGDARIASMVAKIEEERRQSEEAERASEQARRDAAKAEREQQDLVSVERLLAQNPRSTKSVNDLGKAVGNVWELVGALAVLAAFGALIFWIFKGSPDTNSTESGGSTSSVASSTDIPHSTDGGATSDISSSSDIPRSRWREVARRLEQSGDPYVSVEPYNPRVPGTMRIVISGEMGRAMSAYDARELATTARARLGDKAVVYVKDGTGKNTARAGPFGVE